MGKSAKAEVAEYRASIHFGLCVGPVDALKEVQVDGKLAFFSEDGVTGDTVIDIYQPDLFGGREREGGADGLCYYLPGSSSQILPDALADRLLPGATGTGVPGFRGMASLFFVGNADRTSIGETPVVTGLISSIIAQQRETLNNPDLLKGFVWGYNTPYIKDVAVRVQRASVGLLPEVTTIEDDTDAENIRLDSNPAHIIYECLTNTDWGMGSDPSTIDTSSFNAAAQTLFDEDFGLSFEWQQQSTIQEFIDLVISHIEGAVFIHPATGLWTLKLFRDDYSESDLPVFDTTNSVIESFGRRLLGETINEMTVTWTNPTNLKSEPFTLQDLGNVIQQGNIVSDNRPFPGIRRGDLASIVCQRELRAASAALASATVTVNRTGWDLVPGSVILLSSDEHNLADAPFRVLDVDYGRSDARAIKLSVVEDIFSRPYAVNFASQDTFSGPTRVAPTDLTNVVQMTAPYYFNARVQSVDVEEPNALVMVLAASNDIDNYTYDLQGLKVQDNGELGYSLLGTRSILRRALTIAELDAEAETVMVLPGGSAGVPPVVNGFAIIGETEGSREIVFLSAYNSTTGEWTIKRGVLDTVPQAWPVGTTLWIVDLNTPFVDTVHRAEGSDAVHKLLPRTSMGILPIEDATEHTYTVTDRPHRPLRPANCKLNGQGFGTYDGTAVTIITATWAIRNRELEDAQVLYWDSPGVTAEAGQTTTLRIYGLDSNSALDTPHVNEITGITASSYEFDDVDFVGLTEGFVEFIAVRDGYESYQSHKIGFQRTPQDSNSLS